ncbi:MAG TPA: Crp/Fnr family transcriptional regulator [Sphingopyxis sp.]|nr:Crp/Fnr family transcriptional regulator [Sphingopyxis sp.]HMP46082.1 Crp/Fnr family transcriptional regulator [Sphingopyxis sp.]HMQ19072.1 Crp/Fnr family transcriptional regulator [Sphingopyxis sp.]
MAPDLTDILGGDSWFAALPEQQRMALVERGQIHALADGGHVYRIGDAPNGLHAVVDGRVRLVSYPAVGQELVNMIVKPGRWFGELSVIDGRERPHDAIAAGTALILTVPMAAVAALTAAMPDLWRGLALLNCIHHRLGMREAARVRGAPALARLALFLAGGGKADGRLRVTQDELARIVGVSRQHMNGLLHSLADRKLIGLGYGGITIRNRAGLLALAGPAEGG